MLKRDRDKNFLPYIFHNLNKKIQAIEQLRHIYETCNYSEVERECIIALGQSTDPEMLEELYEYAFTQSKPIFRRKNHPHSHSKKSKFLFGASNNLS